MTISKLLPADAVVEDITLTPEQTKVEAVTDEIPISDLTAFVMDDADVPGMEDYRKDSAIKGILSTLTDEQGRSQCNPDPGTCGSGNRINRTLCHSKGGSKAFNTPVKRTGTGLLLPLFPHPTPVGI